MASLMSTPFRLATSKVDQLSSITQKHYFVHSFLPRKPSNSPKTQSLGVKCAVAGNGLFTQTTQEVRRIVAENKQGLPVVKIVYVVLEAQYQSSLSAAVRTLNKSNKFASYEVVGYLVEELRDENNYKSLCLDLEDANIFIGSLIFVEELALKVKAAVEKQRDRMDANARSDEIEQIGIIQHVSTRPIKIPVFPIIHKQKEIISRFFRSDVEVSQNIT